MTPSHDPGRKKTSSVDLKKMSPKQLVIRLAGLGAILLLLIYIFRWSSYGSQSSIATDLSDISHPKGSSAAKVGHMGVVRLTKTVNSGHPKDRSYNSISVKSKTAVHSNGHALPDAYIYNFMDPSVSRKPLPPSETLENEKYWSAASQLRPGLVPSIVHFVWCGLRWFAFKEYLSVLSAIRAIKPDKVIIHYEHLPVIDKMYYHQYWYDLKHDYPFLHIQQLFENETDICNGERLEKVNRILEFLHDDGGIYVGESTWLLKFPPKNRQIDLEFALDSNSVEGYIVLRKNILQPGNSYIDILKQRGYRTKTSECGTVSQLYNGNDNPKCLIVTGGRYQMFYPMQIWDLDDVFGRITRKLFYGTENMLRPKPSYDELVPNIGHMIWIGGGPMDFVFYLSVLSMIYVAKVDSVYIHGDQEPTGEYWGRLKVREADKLQFIIRPPPMQIYQDKIEEYYRALMSDIIRVDIMIKYGGIYTDTDAIWVKPLSKADRGYDAVASFDWVDWSYPFPDSVNFGVSYGKRNAPFWHVFRNSMRILHNHLHGFTGVMMPYKLLEKHPHLLRIDRHLQVICYQMRCHPTWVPNYHNMSNNHVTSNTIPDWRNDVNAFHWTHPNPIEYKDEQTLKNATGLFAEIGQNVLKKAGLL